MEDCEESEINPEFINEILLNEIASKWESQNHTPYTLTEVEEDSYEFREVESHFTVTSRGRTICKLERVENPFLLGQYLLKKEKLREINGVVEERDWFHGTNEECVDSICKTNFDWRKVKASKFGKGVSFSPDVNYATHYTTDNIIIRAKVLECNSTKGDYSTEIPPEGYDTTTNGKGSVFVKYEDDDFYPEYVIHYY